MDYVDYTDGAGGRVSITMSFTASFNTTGKTGHLILLKHTNFLLPGLFSWNEWGKLSSKLRETQFLVSLAPRKQKIFLFVDNSNHLVHVYDPSVSLKLPFLLPFRITGRFDKEWQFSG